MCYMLLMFVFVLCRLGGSFLASVTSKCLCGGSMSAVPGSQAKGEKASKKFQQLNVNILFTVSYYIHFII